MHVASALQRFHDYHDVDAGTPLIEFLIRKGNVGISEERRKQIVE
jgi:hypothetical protein